jgi:peptide-methionine (R)-S-oxide reductase
MRPQRRLARILDTMTDSWLTRPALVLLPALALVAACAAGEATTSATDTGAPLMLDPAAIAALAEKNDAWKLPPDDPSIKVDKPDSEWKKLLSPEQFYVLRQAGTERPGSCALLSVHQAGYFRCAACGLRIFRSGQKFESGTGWPSFWQPISEDRIRTKVDFTLGMSRTEVLCPRCGGHLGHVFDDGPPPTHLRYCMNGVAMAFEPEAAPPPVPR